MPFAARTVRGLDGTIERFSDVVGIANHCLRKSTILTRPLPGS
jgi:hypothetical protein